MISLNTETVGSPSLASGTHPESWQTPSESENLKVTQSMSSHLFQQRWVQCMADGAVVECVDEGVHQLAGAATHS